MVSSQIISLAIDKFRYKGCVSSMFQLVRIAADKTGKRREYSSFF